MFKFLKSLDWFGHPVTLRFNGSGTTHNTICGALCSLIIYLSFWIIVWTLKGDPTIIQNTKKLNLIEHGLQPMSFEDDKETYGTVASAGDSISLVVVSM